MAKVAPSPMLWLTDHRPYRVPSSRGETPAENALHQIEGFIQLKGISCNQKKRAVIQ